MKETKNKPSEQPKAQTIPEPPPVDESGQFDWAGEESTGFENTRPEDLGIPFLVILQKGSPQVDRDHKDYPTKGIEGAQSGYIMNTLTRELLFTGKDPFNFIPASYIKLWQEWRPRAQGGGFVQSHKTASILNTCTRDERNSDVLPNGNTILTTSYFYGFYCLPEDTEWKKAIIAMTSTQLKKARSWLNQMTSIRIGGKMPPMYSHLYQISTVTENNEKGSWKGWKIELNRILTQQDTKVIEEARSTATSMKDQKLLQAPPSDEGAAENPY